MKTKLTDAVVRNLPVPAKGNRITYCATVPNFGVRVTAAGARSFILNYRVRGSGRQRRYTIGDATDWSTGAARQEAQRLKKIIDQGGDPLGDIEAEREAPTVSDLIDRFTEEHVATNRLRPSTAKAYKQLLQKHIRPFFGVHKKVADVQFEDIDKLHRKLTQAGVPYVANRVVQTLSKMFNLAIRWRLREDNPAKGVQRNYEAKRKRYLSGDELPRLIAALAAHPDQQMARVFRVLLLCGCRRGEAEGMKWADLDLTTGTWNKPASGTKQKADHVTPLSAPARQLLTTIAASQEAKGTWVFPSTLSKVGHVIRLERAWRGLLKEADITGLRIHDLRHSFASQLVSSGASLPLIGALLGHSNPRTTSRYAHMFDDPMRKAVDAIGSVITAAGKPVAEPIELKPRGRHGR